jgi:hypothetical protein
VSLSGRRSPADWIRDDDGLSIGVPPSRPPPLLPEPPPLPEPPFAMRSASPSTPVGASQQTLARRRWWSVRPNSPSNMSCHPHTHTRLAAELRRRFGNAVLDRPGAWSPRPGAEPSARSRRRRGAMSRSGTETSPAGRRTALTCGIASARTPSR